MIKIKDDTEFIDFNKSTFFDQFYIEGDLIRISIELQDRLSNNKTVIDDSFLDEDSDRFFRWWITDLQDLNRGTYAYILKLYNIGTDSFDEYEIGILEREIENIYNDYNYSDDNDGDVFVYKNNN